MRIFVSHRFAGFRTLSPALMLVCGLTALGAALTAPAPVRAQTYTFGTVYTFTGGTDGYTPDSGITLDSSGNLYGTTTYGGDSGNGAVFKIDGSTGNFSTVASFETSGSGAVPNAFNPSGPVAIDSSGNIYGTTQSGGSIGGGGVFEITAGSGVITTLASLDQNDGPVARVTLGSSGSLYGVTSSGGDNGEGNVYKVMPDGTLSTVVSFSDTGNGGIFPGAGLVADKSGNLYGTTSDGGSNGDAGTIFKISADGTYTTLASLDPDTGGQYPYTSLVMDSHGNLFGTALTGGDNGLGTLFELVAGSTTITTLASFDGINGQIPIGTNLVIDSSGNIFGETRGGGANGSGSVFEYSASTGDLTSIYSFTGGDDGYHPSGNLAIDSEGNLYGTTQYGGANSDGTVFKLSVSGGTSSAAPEPGSFVLAGVGLAGSACAAVRRRKRLSLAAAANS